MVGVIIQSRMGSTRLPGKSLSKIQGNPLLYYSVARSMMSKYAENVIVATTTNREDDAIEDWCNLSKVDCYRGSEENVLERYYKAALKYNFKIIVRLTADNPFVDPQIIDLLITNILTYNSDYITMRNKTNTWPYGLDVEVFTLETLQKVFESQTTKFQEEHVTNYIIDNINEFDTLEVPLDHNLAEIRLTVDYEEDYIRADKLMKILLDNVGVDFNWHDVVYYYDKIDAVSYEV